MMRDERDADDARMLEDGDIAGLLATYQDIIVGRCIAALRGDLAAEDVAQNVRLRLVAEFQRGKRYSVPYRVVVHQVIDWTIKEHFQQRDTTVPLPEDWEPAVESSSESVLSRYYLADLFASLPEQTRKVLELRYLAGLDIEQIAERLGLKRNAVDQALHRGHTKLREALGHG
jgi:RNA polymerase sigma factor (sigma-70 family)